MVATAMLQAVNAINLCSVAGWSSGSSLGSYPRGQKFKSFPCQREPSIKALRGIAKTSEHRSLQPKKARYRNGGRPFIMVDVAQLVRAPVCESGG